MKFTKDEFHHGLRSFLFDLACFWSPKSDLTIPDFAEQKRKMPKGTPFPGPWENARTPYLVEPMMNMDPSSPIQVTIFAKSAQMGVSAMAENVCGFFMGEEPAEILFVSATESLLKKWVSKRLEPLIDSCGIRSKIVAQGAKKRKQRTGDLTFQKEFAGGALDMASAQSASSLRADSKRILIIDEADGAPAQLHTGEGNWYDVAYVRTNAWGSRRKVLMFSTPTTYERSMIWKEYLRGDCRRYSVACPSCGSYQFLEWEGKNDSGIKWTVKDNGHLGDVWYQCEHCGGAIHSWQKADLLKSGNWVPTSVSESKYIRSYHISGLYAPEGMLSWEEIVEAYRKAQKQPDGMAGFVNLYLGEPFRELGQRPKVDSVINLRSNYKAGTITDDRSGGGLLFLTMAIDVQRGSERDKKNPPRLEVEVCGHGGGYRSWSVQYFVIEGEVTNPYTGAWDTLNKMAIEGMFKFKRKDGRVFSPLCTLIDSKDGTNIDTVFQFCAGWRNTYPCAGANMLKKTSKSEIVDTDEVTRQNFDRYRITRQKNDTTVIMISTNYYKHLIYRSLDIKPGDTGINPPGFCSFPLDYPRSYFEMLTAEEKKTDGSFICPSGRRNEALDLRVYNLAARDFYIDTKVQEMRDMFQQRGGTKAQLLEIRSSTVLKEMAKVVGLK